MSRKLKIIASVVILFLISVPLFFKKEKGFLEISKISGSFDIKTSIMKFDSNNVIYVKCIFKNAGVLHNPIGKRGISAVAGELLFRRIGKLSPEETLQKLFDLGVKNISIMPFEDDFEISFLVLKDNIIDALKFLSKAFSDPVIKNGDLEYKKEMFPDLLDIDVSSPNELMNDKLLGMLYKDGSYGLNKTGTPQAISGITAGDLKDFIKTRFTRKNLEVIFAGNVSRFDADSYLRTLFKDISSENDLAIITVNNKADEKAKLLGKLSDEKVININKQNMNDVIGVMSGIRLDELSEVESAAAYIISETIFNNGTGDFVKNLRLKNIAYNVKVRSLKRSLSESLYITVYVDKKDLENYQQYLSDKISEYAKKLNLKDLEKTKKRLIETSEIGILDMRDMHGKMKEKLMLFQKVNNKVLEKVAAEMFEKTKIRSVIIGNIDG